MRLNIKDESSNGTKGTNGANGSNGAAHAKVGNGAEKSAGKPRGNRPSRPLVSMAFRTLDATARALSESLLQLLNGVAPYVPIFRIRETNDSIIVSGHLPRVQEDSIQIVFDGRMLRIHGTRTRQEERIRRKYRRVETVSRTFEHAIPLYCDAESEKMVATLRDDLLRIHVRKKAALSQPLRARITVGDESVAHD